MHLPIIQNVSLLSQPFLFPQIMHVHFLSLSSHCVRDEQQVLSDDTFWNEFWQDHLLVQCAIICNSFS